MNAKSEFAPGRSERWRHPEPRQPAWAAGRQQQAQGRDKTSRELTPSGTPQNSEFTTSQPSSALVAVGLSIQLTVINDTLLSTARL